MRALYIAPNGNDRNDGSRTSPWKTLDHDLRPGDTVFFREGRYSQQIVLKDNGEPGNPITVAGFPGESARIEGVSGELYIVNLTGRSDITIENLLIQFSPNHEDPEKKWAWISVRGSDRVTIRDLRIRKEADPLTDYRRGYRESAIEISDSDDVTVESCRITGINKGIGIRNSSRNTHLVGNTISATVQSCIVLGSSQGRLRGALIEENTLEKSVIEDGIQFLQNFEASDPSKDTSNRGTTIRNNVIRENAENAVDLKGAGFVTIEGNTIYGTIGSNDGNLNEWNRSSLFAIGRGARAICQDVIIRNNILYDNANGIWVDGLNNKIYNNTLLYNNRDYSGSPSDWVSTQGPNFYGLRHQYTGQRNIGIRNNLIGGHVRGGQVALRIANSNTLDIDYNLYFAGTGGAEYLTDYNTSGDWDQYPFPAWQGFLNSQTFVTGKDAHSQFTPFTDVAFVNVPEQPSGDHTQYDFAIQQRSSAFRAGGPLTATASAGTNSTLLRVEDASWFSDGYGSSLVDGDTIRVGSSTANITAIDLESNILTIDRPLSWSRSAPVFFGKSASPNIGAQPDEFEPPISLPWLRQTVTTVRRGVRAGVSS